MPWERNDIKMKKQKGITLIALIVTIVLNCSSLAMERMYKKEKILKIYLERILDRYSFFAYNLDIKINGE